MTVERKREAVNVGNSLSLLWICNSMNDAEAAICAGIDWIFVDIEVRGKAARQPTTSFISDHKLCDVKAIKAGLPYAQVVLRLNPLYRGTASEIEDAISFGADAIMLPMFSSLNELNEVRDLIRGRAQFWPLVETPGACQLMTETDVGSLGLDRIHFGLNDLHIALHYRFMFSSLLDPGVTEALSSVEASGVPFGLGGVSKLDQGALLGSDVLNLNFLLGSTAVILSQEFRRNAADGSLAQSVAALKEYWSGLSECNQIDVNSTLADIYKKIRGLELSIV